MLQPVAQVACVCMKEGFSLYVCMEESVCVHGLYDGEGVGSCQIFVADVDDRECVCS